MIALHSLGESELCRALWDPIKRCTEENANAILLAHLSAAASGAASANVHRVLRAIFNGDTEGVIASLDGVAAIGHSSGWDTMTGVITTVEAWLSAQTANRRD